MSRHEPGDAAMQRELTTVRVMIAMYCQDHHGTDDALCPSCARLLAYATERIDRCPFGAGKPTCAKCTAHCYKRDMREAIREVMRYAGPRMLLRHPVLALRHALHGRSEAPSLPSRRPGSPESRLPSTGDG